VAGVNFRGAACRAPFGRPKTPPAAAYPLRPLRNEEKGGRPEAGEGFTWSAGGRRGL